MFIGLRNDYALYEVSGDGVETVRNCGSNPHAPTNFLSKNALLNPQQFGRQIGAPKSLKFYEKFCIADAISIFDWSDWSAKIAERIQRMVRSAHGYNIRKSCI